MTHLEAVLDEGSTGHPAQRSRDGGRVDVVAAKHDEQHRHCWADRLQQPDASTASGALRMETRAPIRDFVMPVAQVQSEQTWAHNSLQRPGLSAAEGLDAPTLSHDCVTPVPQLQSQQAYTALLCTQDAERQQDELPGLLAAPQASRVPWKSSLSLCSLDLGSRPCCDLQILWMMVNSTGKSAGMWLTYSSQLTRHAV